MIVVLSVQHSGTFFTLLEIIKKQPTGLMQEGGEAYYGHFSYTGDSKKRLISLVEMADLVITPMRHPLAVFNSWDKDLLQSCYESMCEMVEFKNSHKLPIDSYKRKSILEELNIEQPNWELRVNTQPSTNKELKNNYWADRFMSEQVEFCHFYWGDIDG